MRIKKEDLTQELLHATLNYNPNNGHLTWKTKEHCTSVFAGDRAGSVSNKGYRVVGLFGIQYQEHQLIWFYVYGKWARVIDHINHVKDDNRISNLREVTHRDNMRNLSKRKNTLSGSQGVYYRKDKDRFIAAIKVNGKRVFQKSFRTEDEALEARRAKLIQLGFHENHGK